MLSGSARYNTTLAEAERDNAYYLTAAGCAGQDAGCLRAASTATLMSAIHWNAYPGRSGAGVSGFPIPGFSWGNLAIVDGVVIPVAPVDALRTGRAPVRPLIVASTAQETDLFPLLEVGNLSWAAYDALAREKMAPFGPDAVTAALKFYPNVGDPELQYSSLSSDIGVTCPNSVVGKQIAASRKTRGPNGSVTLYRYVLTARPSHPMAMFGSPHHAVYSFHTLDSVFLFNTTQGSMEDATPGGARRVPPTAGDLATTAQLRASIGVRHFPAQFPPG